MGHGAPPRTHENNTCCRAFGSGAVTTCFYDSDLSRLGFELTTFRIRRERSKRLRHYFFCILKSSVINSFVVTCQSIWTRIDRLFLILYPPPKKKQDQKKTRIDRWRIIFVPGKKRSGRNVRIIIFVPFYTYVFVPATMQCVLYI